MYGHETVNEVFDDGISDPGTVASDYYCCCCCSLAPGDLLPPRLTRLGRSSDEGRGVRSFVDVSARSLLAFLLDSHRETLFVALLVSKNM